MKKALKITSVLFTLILFSSIIFFACNKYKQSSLSGDQSSINSKSNGGFVIDRDKYIYFVNGYREISDIKSENDNKFGKVSKGAIYRAEKENLSKTSVIAPITMYDTSKEGGIYIIGNWLYYASPDVYVSKNTNRLETSKIKYMRTSLDRTKTQEIAVYSSSHTEHKFTKNGLYVKEGSSIYFHPYDNNNVKKEKEKKTITKKAREVIMPIFKEVNVSKYEDSIIYTLRNEDSSKKDVIYLNTLGKEEKIFEAEGTEKYELKGYGIDNKEVILYYNTSDVFNPQNFFYSSKISDFKKSIKIIRKLPYNGDFNHISYEQGILIIQNNQFIQLKDGEEIKISEAKTPSTPKLVKIVGNKIYYILDRILYVFDRTNKELPKQVIKEKILDTWFMPEFIENKIFFINSENNKINYVNLSELKDEALLGKEIKV